VTLVSTLVALVISLLETLNKYSSTLVDLDISFPDNVVILLIRL
jgi:hypothetical protein